MSTVAKGSFQVKLASLAFEGQPPGSKLGRMTIDKQISGALVGLTGEFKILKADGVHSYEFIYDLPDGAAAA